MWDEKASFINICNDDTVSNEKNGKSCQNLCTCLGGRYVINPIAFLIGATLILLCIGALLCFLPCLCFLGNKTQIAHNEMEKWEEKVLQWEEDQKRMDTNA